MVRRKGKYASRTFRVKSLADEWPVETKRLIDPGGEPSRNNSGKTKTIGDLIDLHITDLQKMRKPLRRSKRTVSNALKVELGCVRIIRLDCAMLI